MNTSQMKIKRKSEYERVTKETQISVSLAIDGTGQNSIHTGFGMFDHMLDLLAFWAEFNLTLDCEGDLHVDAHHTMEDTGLALGAALNQALGDHAGIERAGYGRIPMDEALAEASVDISGRSWLEWRNGDLLPPIIAGEEKDVWREFYKAFASAAKMNIHINFLYGLNGHHLLESAAKGLGIALRHAVSRRGSAIRSTKGGLDL